MATDSMRLDALEGVVTQIAGANGSSPYWNDLSGTDQVGLKVQTKSSLFGMPYSAWVWVRDGSHNFVATSASSLTYETEFDIICECLVRDNSSDTIVEELNKLIQDVVWAIGTDNTLGGAVCDAWVENISEPEYHASDNSGSCAVTVRTRYDIEQGVSI